MEVFIDAYNSKNTKGIVGRLYKAITSMNKSSTDYIKERWEKELNVVITEDMWTKAWETQSTTTSSFFWRDFCWKTLTRFFITPYQKSKSSGMQHFCWRECGSDSGHAHMFSPFGGEWEI